MSLGKPTVPVRKRRAAKRKHKRNHFRQRDVTRMLKAYKAADVPQPIIEISPDGKLIAIPNDAQHSGGRASADETPEGIISQL
jgi:hypothetical protein